MKNNNIYALIMELGSKLSDYDFVWPQELRENFEIITKELID